MQNQELASLVLNTLGFIVKPQDITIRSEIGAGIHIRCTGEHRFDMEIIDFQSQTTYDFELQNYNENISFKMTIRILKRIISDFDIKKNDENIKKMQEEHNLKMLKETLREEVKKEILDEINKNALKK